MVSSVANHDPVNHPKHYTQYPVEVIELTEHMGFCLGNAVKYLLRWRFKNGLEDLKKAQWYLRRGRKTSMPLHEEAYKRLRDAWLRLRDHVPTPDDDVLFFLVEAENPAMSKGRRGDLLNAAEFILGGIIAEEEKKEKENVH